MKFKEVIPLKWSSYAPFLEAKKLPDDGSGFRKYLVTLLTEGKGNPRDKHYYSQECIDNPVTAEAFNGKPCFINHADAISEQTRPERDLRDQAGWFNEVHAEGNALKGTLTLAAGKQGDELEGFIETAFAYAKENPGQNYCGLSINGGGPTKAVNLDGEQWKQVDVIAEADSCDAVTKPGRGGMFEKKLQAFREAQVSGVEKILMALRQKAEAGPVDPKDIKRMTDSAISALHGNETEPSQGGGTMKNKKKLEAMREARKKKFPGMSEEEAKHAAKSLAGFHAGNAESETDPAKKAIHAANAEKYSAMCSEEEDEAAGDEPGDEPGDTIVKTKGEPDAEPDAESEEEAEEEAEEDAEEEANLPSFAKKKLESLRKENKKLRTTVAFKEAQVKSGSHKLFENSLKDSGLPASWHESIRISCEGKSLKESSAILAAEVEKYEGLFQESGAGLPRMAQRRTLDGGTDAFKETEAELKKRNLID